VPAQNLTIQEILDAQLLVPLLNHQYVGNTSLVYRAGDCQWPAPTDVMPPNLVDTECYEGCLDGEVFNAIRNGVPPDYYMEPWQGRITDENIWNIVNYLNSLKE
jgi:hypothetical protein